MNLIVGKWRYCPRFVSSLIALLAFILFLSLGSWQLDRAEYKRTLYKDFLDKQAQATVEIKELNVSEKNESHLWRPVFASGIFFEKPQVLLDNRVVNGKPGYFVYTPFSFDNKKTWMLVNRGWVEAGNDRSKAPSLISTDASITIISGVVKEVPKTGVLLDDSVPERINENILRVQNVDIKQLELLLNMKLSPFIFRLDLESEHGYLRNWQLPGSGENVHLGYAFQWFAFAAVLLIIYLFTNIKTKEKVEKKMNEKSNNRKNKILIISVVIAFLSPLILSWLVFNYTDFIKFRGTSNHGELIEPPRPLQDLALIDPFQEKRKESLHGKWSMFYIAERCDERCIENVYRMRQLHSTMDKHSLRVQKVLLLIDQEVSEVKSMLTDYAGQQIINLTTIDKDELLDKFRLTGSDHPEKDGRLYIVDPLGNLMMYFEYDANPRDIMKDLKKLLRASRIG